VALTDNLVSYWKLDESSGNASDSVGSNTLTNTSVTYSTGKINNGAVFNESAYYNSGNNLAQTGNFSISCWVKKVDDSNGGVIFGDVDYAVDYGWTLISINNSNKLYFHVKETSGEPVSVTSSGSITAAAGWTHFVCVRDGTNIIIYINGSYDNQTAWSSAQTSTQRGTYFGAAKQGGGFLAGNYLKGNLDEFGIWSRALSSTEVTSLYNSGNGTQYPFVSVISFLIEEVLALSESISNLRSRLFDVAETLGLVETWTALKGIAFNIADTLGLVETFTATRTFLFNIAESTGLVEVLAQVKLKWEKLTKSSSTWSNSTKNTSTFTKQSKSSSSWSNQSKN